MKLFVNFNNNKEFIIKRIITIVLTVVLASLVIVLFARDDYYKNEYTISMNEEYGTFSKLVKAKITSIDNYYYPTKEERKSFTLEITFHALLKEGKHKGKVVEGVQRLNDYTTNFTNKVKKGKVVYLIEEESPYGTELTYSFAGDSISFDHWGGIIALFIILSVLLLVISKTKGILTIVSLALTVAVIVFIFLPSILVGKNIYLLTILCAVYIVAVTFVLVVGLNKKCLCASLGCMAGLLLSGLLTLMTLRIINATGYFVQEDDEEIIQLFQTYYNNGMILDLKGIVFASTIIGALGAVMDVSLSLASALKEVYDNSAHQSFASTIKSGFVIGKDMIGTMVNTLVLAYIATDLTFILWIMTHHSNGFIMQSEYIAVAIAQALVGAIAMVVTIPLTSIVCALIYNRKR